MLVKVPFWQPLLPLWDSIRSPPLILMKNTKTLKYLWYFPFPNKICHCFIKTGALALTNVVIPGTVIFAKNFLLSFRKQNRYIPQLLPSVYYLDSQRNLETIQNHLLSFMENDLLNQMRTDCCLFDRAKTCTHCFSCMDLINKKTPQELNAFETEKLLEYKLYHLNLKDFSSKVNQHFGQNSQYHGQVIYDLTCHTGDIFKVQGYMKQKHHAQPVPLTHLGKGMRSIYLLSLLEAYMEGEDRLPALILMEDPEIYLHPQLQKISSVKFSFDKTYCNWYNAPLL